MKLILLLTFIISTSSWSDTLNNKTPVPTIEAAQESGFYEGANSNPTMTKKQRENKQRMEQKIDIDPSKENADPTNEHQRVPLVPNP